MTKLDFNYLETRRKIEAAIPGVRVSIYNIYDDQCFQLVFEFTKKAEVYLEDPDEILSDKRLLRKIRRELLNIPWWAFWR